MFWLYHDKAFRENVRQVHTFIDHFVQSALARSRGEKSGSAGGGDDAEKQKYVFLHALAEQTQDPVELRSQLLNILLAGRDTTASTLGWFFYLVALPENEKVYQRLRTIILDEFGTYSNPKNITFETLKNCQYLQWCINETLRVYPIVPVNARTAVVDTCLPTGGGPDGKSPVYVKKGEDVLYSVSENSSSLTVLFFVETWYNLLDLALTLHTLARYTSCTAAKISGAKTQMSGNQTGGRTDVPAGTTCPSTADRVSA